MSIDATTQLGQHAFAAFQLAVETGNDGPLLAMAAEDISFFVPLPFEQWRGEQRGRQRLAELIAFERNEMQLEIRFTATNTLACRLSNYLAHSIQIMWHTGRDGGAIGSLAGIARTRNAPIPSFATAY